VGRGGGWKKRQARLERKKRSSLECDWTEQGQRIHRGAEARVDVPQGRNQGEGMGDKRCTVGAFVSFDIQKRGLEIESKNKE